jgi:hypothetical protein
VTEYYYNMRTGEVEEGRVSTWKDLMGPYLTREEAERALEIAAERTAAEDERDRRWREGGGGVP